MIAFLVAKRRLLADAPEIEHRIRDAARRTLGLSIASKFPEYQSWHNSLGNAMFHEANTVQVRDDPGVGVEQEWCGTAPCLVA